MERKGIKVANFLSSAIRCLLLSAPASSFDRTGERITESIAHVCENINSHQAAVGRSADIPCVRRVFYMRGKQENCGNVSFMSESGDSWMDSEDDISAQRERAEVGPGGRSPISMARRSPKTKSLQTLFTAPLSLA
ncbi:hypothetical protein DAPPUDRAFT_112942 [Daphnia pulex]|uniref:Uncharacterized protein n=1 Tax=Daphnia pulex TaxID=6669 RepID=E9HDJ3_DAPPU|nr:hypothetical protein DAPPUDRAFT_112942 [Daphnia pulex]|eukprot:EFX70151.1 hypothetical protein DAPPUDRAFT_112942 [Daphnia pulex]